MKYNPTTGEFWFNGAATKNLMTCTDTNFAYNEGKTAEDCAKVVITSIGITNAAGGCTATFDMDNFVQYEEVSDDDALASARAALEAADGAIVIDDDGPQWVRSKCQHCMGCINRCPSGIIQYKGRTQKRRRYVNPRVRL